MRRELILKDFRNSALTHGAGGISVSAGRFSRSAIVAVFQLNGGIESFADWAKANPTDFYTRMFGRVIGKEAQDAPKSSEDVDDLLDEIEDAEFEDITDKVDARVSSDGDFTTPDMKKLLAEIATAYSKSENEEA